MVVPDTTRIVSLDEVPYENAKSLVTFKLCCTFSRNVLVNILEKRNACADLLFILIIATTLYLFCWKQNEICQYLRSLASVENHSGHLLPRLATVLRCTGIWLWADVCMYLAMTLSYLAKRILIFVVEGTSLLLKMISTSITKLPSRNNHICPADSTEEFDLSDEEEAEPMLPLTSRSERQFSSGAITEGDLAELIWRIEVVGGDHCESSWTKIVERSSSTLSYAAQRRDHPAGDPCEYLSTTNFRNCSSEKLKKFYLDSEYSLKWDSVLKSVQSVSLCRETGIETAIFVKQYPACRPVAYVLAWRVWRGPKEGEFYCVTKAVNSSVAAGSLGVKTVDKYTSMWKISPSGDDSCQIQCYVQDSNGCSEIGKFMFRKAIWGYMKASQKHLQAYEPESEVSAMNTPISEFPALLSNPSGSLVSDKAGGPEVYLEHIKGVLENARRAQATGVASSSPVLTQVATPAKSAPPSQNGSRRAWVVAGACSLVGGAILVSKSANFTLKFAAVCVIKNALRPFLK